MRVRGRARRRADTEPVRAICLPYCCLRRAGGRNRTVGSEKRSRIVSSSDSVQTVRPLSCAPHLGEITRLGAPPPGAPLTDPPSYGRDPNDVRRIVQAAHVPAPSLVSDAPPSTWDALPASACGTPGSGTPKLGASAPRRRCPTSAPAARDPARPGEPRATRAGGRSPAPRGWTPPARTAPATPATAPTRGRWVPVAAPLSITALAGFGEPERERVIAGHVQLRQHRRLDRALAHARRDRQRVRHRRIVASGPRRVVPGGVVDVHGDVPRAVQAHRAPALRPVVGHR